MSPCELYGVFCCFVLLFNFVPRASNCAAHWVASCQQKQIAVGLGHQLFTSANTTHQEWIQELIFQRVGGAKIKIDFYVIFCVYKRFNDNFFCSHVAIKNLFCTIIQLKVKNIHLYYFYTLIICKYSFTSKYFIHISIKITICVGAILFLFLLGGGGSTTPSKSILVADEIVWQLSVF